jgi:RNA polymerase sigma factor (sigma-70 family)
MVRLARVLVDSPQAAEDIVQDAFVALHRRWDGVREPRPYLHRSVVNGCRSFHRRSGRERSRTVPGPPDLRTDPDPTVEGSVLEARSDDAGLLEAALGRLPYRQRSALVLRFYVDLPDRAIAEILGCRVGTVGSLVHRGLQGLREVVQP